MKSRLIARTRGTNHLDGWCPVVSIRSIEGAIHPEQDRTMDMKRILISQILMTLIMASTMSAIMLLISVGPTQLWLDQWPRQFLTAWPIAFVMTNVAWPVSQALTRLILPASTRAS